MKLCGYRATANGLPCSHPISGKSGYCAAGHPQMAVSALKAGGAHSSDPSSFDPEELLASTGDPPRPRLAIDAEAVLEELLGGPVASAALEGAKPAPPSKALAEVDAAFGPIDVLAEGGLVAGDTARRQIASLPSKDRREVVKFVVKQLRKHPMRCATGHGATHLFSAEFGEMYRLRAGRARLIVAVDKEHKTVTVKGVGLRPS